MRMWQNSVQPDRPQIKYNTIRSMRTACWKTRPQTHTQNT